MSAGPASPTRGGHRGYGRGPGKLAGRGRMQHGRPAPENNRGNGGCGCTRKRVWQSSEVRAPKGSRRSTYTRSSHVYCRSGQSAGCTGQRRKAWRMSAFATNAFLSKPCTMAMAASTEVYRTATSSGNARITRGSTRRGQIQNQVHRAVGPLRGAEGGAMEEPEWWVDEKGLWYVPGRPPGPLQR